MAATWAVTSIGIVVISFVVGFIFYYFVISSSKAESKRQLEEISQLIVNFVLFIWSGKIILNFPVFIRDPFAILAYPSSSYAFYLACLFISLNIGYKVKWHALKAHSTLASFVPIFFVASFMYEFIYGVWGGHTLAWSYLSLLMVLLVVFMLIHEQTSSEVVTYFLLMGWVVGQFILALVTRYTTAFGYRMAPSFLVALLIFFVLLFIHSKKRKVS